MSIFLSYCEEDAKLVHRVFWILFRMHLEPYAYMLYPEPGEFIHDVVIRRINRSDYVIPFLTRDGVRSQWVNQEIGAAHALGKYIIPIREVGVESKGFVELRHYIDYSPSNPEGMISSLIWRLRTLLSPEAMDVKCPKCGATTVVGLASFELTREAISEGKNLGAKCKDCQHVIVFNPRTQEVIG